MRDSLDPSAANDISLAYLLQNCYPADPSIADALVGRPGFQKAGAQLTGGGVGQLVYQFTKLDGTEKTIVVAGGRIFLFDWGARTWSEPVTTANLTTASITLSTTAKCYAVTIADQMVVSDGVNVPFAWDGTSGASGLTSLTNSPVLFGQPTVYYAKLFGIKNTERSTIVWSEENDPTTGYEAGGFNNSWTLGQSDQNALYALVGTNEALYYFRARSIGVISGAVNTDFTTSGVHDSVSGVVGTQSPGATVYYEGRIYFPDSDWNPYVVVPGAGVEPLWDDIKETVRGMDKAYIAKSVGVYDASTKNIILGMVETGQTIPSAQIVIDPDQGSGQIAAVWRGFTFTAMGLVKNASGQPLLMHLSSDGYAYDHGLPDGSLWSDGLNSGTVAIQHVVKAGPLGVDVALDKRFDRLDLTLRTTSDMTNLSVCYESSRGLGTQRVVPLIQGSYSRWDFFVWDTDVWSGSSVDQHLAVGWNGFGRWVRPMITHDTLGEQFGLSQMRVTAYPLNVSPGNP